MNKLLYIVILLLTLPAVCQERQNLLGRIIAGPNGVPDVFVINKTAGQEVKTDDKGYFTIKAKSGDGLILYNSRIIVREFTLNQDSFKTSPLVISVNYGPQELDEVVINKYGKINSEALGIVPKGQKRYTVAERRLYNASAMTVGTVVGLDPLINAISGRTRMLKKAYEIEKLESSLNLMGGLYNEDEIMENYKIPEQYVKGFMYYAIENKEFAGAIKGRNKTLANFLLTDLAEKYLKLIANDK